jgi:DNA-3-methyladenine glycosylase II
LNANDFFVDPVPPFRLDLTVWTLRRRPDNIVDRWDGHTYRRVLALAAGTVEVAVTQAGPPEAPRLQVAVEGLPLDAGVQSVVVSVLDRLLGLDIDLTGFYRFASHQAHLGPLVRRFRGMKPPRMPTLFECALNAIACQQVTLTLGLRILNRLAAAFGPALRTLEGAVHAFPRPEDLVGQDPAELRKLGLSHQKGRAMVELAQTMVAGRLDPGELASLPDAEAVARLRQLRGVGRWTAEYMLLRGLGRVHIFPGDDVGGRNNLRRWLKLTETLDYEGTRRALARWKRFGGLVYFHLLLDRIAEAGWLSLAGSISPPESNTVASIPPQV